MKVNFFRMYTRLLLNTGGRADAPSILGLTGPVLSGVYAGSLTNTPALAASASLWKSQQPVVGYSVAWFHDWNLPFRLLGGLFLVGAVCWLFVDPRKALFGDPLNETGAAGAPARA